MAILSAVIAEPYAQSEKREIKIFFEKLKVSILTQVKPVVTLNSAVVIFSRVFESIPAVWQVRYQLTTQILVTLSSRVGAGHSLVSDEALWAALSRFGEIKKGRRLYFQEFPDTENGVWQFVIIPKSGSMIPSSNEFWQSRLQSGIQRTG